MKVLYPIGVWKSLKLLLAAIVLACLSTYSHSAGTYFPPNSLEPNSELSTFVESWFAKQLAALGESPLYPAQIDKRIYRFTWLRTFHHPMTFRLEIQSDGSGILYARETSGAGGYDPGKLLNSVTIQVSRKDVEGFERQLVGFGFWSMPSNADDEIIDGAEWILEGSAKGIYHFVKRTSPQATPFASSMLYLMKLTNMELGEIY